MRRKLLLLLLTLMPALAIQAQTHPLSGEVLDPEAKPLVFASVLLLNPADSTLQFYGITNQEGHFDIKNIKENKYLLQISSMGYQTLYRNISVPVKAGNTLGTLVLESAPVDVGEVKVVGERVPLAIKKDTVEYNAAAFKLKSDAVTEDLLKKLPGIEVDRAGNVKAMGEDVRKVYVDGKEFFGNDPKIATRNIPAKAVEKVQVYDRKSEESMFTNINDGSREKTINLQLQEDQKKALFGDLTAGGGTNERYLGSAKAYRFTDKIQLAGLGMINNVNQFGFSMNDYINFSGGMGAMMSGGGTATIRISSDGSFPVNFGQPVSGLNTSGAGGVNFSKSSGPNNRFFISYVGNGSEKDLIQNTRSENFLAASTFLQTDSLNQTQTDGAHRVNFGLRHRIDSTQNLNLNGNFSYTSGTNYRDGYTRNMNGNLPVNQLESLVRDKSGRVAGDLSGSYVIKLNPGKTVLELSGNGSFSSGISKTGFQNTTQFFQENNTLLVNQFQDNYNNTLNYSGSAVLTRKIGKFLYMEPSIRVGILSDLLERKQGIPQFQEGFSREGAMVIDSLSPQFVKQSGYIRPGLKLNRNRENTRVSLGLQAETGWLNTSLEGATQAIRTYFRLLPALTYENEYKPGKRIMLNAGSSVNTPQIIQLLPVVNNINPLSVVTGNPYLEPEYVNRFNLHWLFFDQFSFTSLFTGFNTTLTENKISWNRTIGADLQQKSTYYNAGNDIRMSGNATFSTPVRWLGIKINLNLEESWNKGENLINLQENSFTNLSHRISFSADNRKKEKVDINSGVELTMTRSRYSIQKNLDNNYFDISWFAELRYNPTPKWNFEASADVTRYTASSFGESVNIPLIGAEITRYLMKNNRGTLTLRGFDLLNQNKIVQRTGDLNYLRETRSNSMGRYIMLTFAYRLNQFGNAPGGVDVRVMRR